MNKRYLSYSDIEHNVQHIAREILLGDWRPDYIVGITRGGLLPATLLSQYLNIPMTTLDVSLRDNRMEMGPESNFWMSEDAMDGKNILIVDDINDTGATIEWIIDDWKRSSMPDSPLWDNVFGRNVRFAVIVDNQSINYTECNYCGLEINKAVKDEWIVFPWEEWWLNE